MKVFPIIHSFHIFCVELRYRTALAGPNVKLKKFKNEVFLVSVCKCAITSGLTSQKAIRIGIELNYRTIRRFSILTDRARH